MALLRRHYFVYLAIALLLILWRVHDDKSIRDYRFTRPSEPEQPPPLSAEDGQSSSSSSSSDAASQDHDRPSSPPADDATVPQHPAEKPASWAGHETTHPVGDYSSLPDKAPVPLAKIQNVSFPETEGESAERKRRMDIIRNAFLRGWEGYKRKAWLKDELRSQSGRNRVSTTGGWAETMIEALDGLFIMGSPDNFREAVDSLNFIDFNSSRLESVDIHVVSSRHLGGLLSAYDLSGEYRLLEKAVEVGNMLYTAFDTKNHMPVTRFDFSMAQSGEEQTPPQDAALGELTGWMLDFTRLTQVTGDAKWFDAVKRVVEALKKQQDMTKLPGMWPEEVDLETLDFTKGTGFSLGPQSRSAYEYLPKLHALLGGVEPALKEMYTKAMKTALPNTLFRPMTPLSRDVLMVGNVTASSPYHLELEPKTTHMSCYVGGMLGLGGRLFQHDEHIETAKKLVEGCIWAYNAFAFGLMPEAFHLAKCDSQKECKWNQQKWKDQVAKRIPETVGGKTIPQAVRADVEQWIKEDLLPRGFTSIEDRRYLLRPEAIESIFYLYRITGDKRLQNIAWKIFENINQFTASSLGNTALYDVTVKGKTPLQLDRMHGYWLSETLKYFFLTFSDPNILNLDQYVFNSAGHPFNRNHGP